MVKLFDKINDKNGRDLRVLGNFIAIFCRENHPELTKNILPVKDERLSQALGDIELELCQECSRLFQHGAAKMLLCPYDPKPMCKKCETHCYAPGYRERIREVMRFSGLYLVKHGRVDLMMHYFL